MILLLFLCCFCVFTISSLVILQSELFYHSRTSTRLWYLLCAVTICPGAVITSKALISGTVPVIRQLRTLPFCLPVIIRSCPLGLLAGGRLGWWMGLLCIIKTGPDQWHNWSIMWIKDSIFPPIGSLWNKGVLMGVSTETERSSRWRHDDVIKWKHFPRNWPLVRGIHRSRCPGEFPTQRPVTRSFDVFFDLRLNKPMSKQPWGSWFETLSRSLWRHRNELVVTDYTRKFRCSQILPPPHYTRPHPLDQSVRPCSYPFSRKRGIFFSKGGTNSRNQEKWVIFLA